MRASAEVAERRCHLQRGPGHKLAVTVWATTHAELCQPDAVDLIRLSDDVNSVAVSIHGRAAPGILPHHDLLAASIEVTSPFITATFQEYAYPVRVDGWSRALEVGQTDRRLVWTDESRSCDLEFDGTEAGLVTARLHEAPVSGVELRIPVVTEWGRWIDLQQQLVAEVLRAYPRQVIERSGFYAWASGRPPTRSDGK
jgi:hypothetical protein